MERKPPDLDSLPHYMTSDFAVEEVEKPTRFQAMLETENTAVSAYKYLEDIPDDFDRIDPTFDAVAAANTMNVPEEQRINLMQSRNVNEFIWKKDNYNREIENRAVISEMGTWESLGFGLLAVGIDPVVWGMTAIPVMRAASLAGKMGKGAQIGAIDGTATEVVLNNTQTERGADETMLNLGGTILFGSVLGGLAYRGDIREALKESNIAKQELDDAGVGFTKTEEIEYTNSAGAKEVRTGRKYADKDLQAETWNRLEREEITPAEADEIIDNNALERSTVIGAGISQKFRNLTLSLYGAHSPNVEVRSQFSDLAENTILINMHKEMASPGQALDTFMETLESSYIVPYIQTVKTGYEEYIGTKWAAFQLIKGLKAKAFNGKDYVSAKEWNEGLTMAKHYEGNIPAGIYEPELTKALNKTSHKLKPLDDEFEEELVKWELLHPENFEEGVKLEKAIYDLDKEVKSLGELEDKSLERVFEEEGKQNLARAEISMAEVKDFDQVVANEWKADKSRTSGKLKTVTDKLNRSNPKKRRDLKGRYDAAANKYAQREKLAKQALTNVEKTKPSDAYENVANLKKLRDQLEKSSIEYKGGRTPNPVTRATQATKATTALQKKFQAARKAESKNGQKEIDAYETKLNEAKATYKKARQTFGENSQFARSQQQLQNEYRRYPSEGESVKLKEQKKSLTKELDELEKNPPVDIGLEEAWKLNRKEVGRYQRAKAKKSRARSKDAYTDLEIARTGTKDANEKLAILWKERDEFKYSPLKGNIQGGGWYSNRMYRTFEVHADRVNFIRRGTDDKIAQMEEAVQKLERGTDEYEKAFHDMKLAHTKPGRDDIAKSVKETWKDITSSQTGHSAKQASLSNRFLAERKFTVRNKALVGDPKKGDINYLESDVLALKKAHLHAMIPQLVMKKKGYNHAERMARIDDKWEQLIDANPKKAKKYLKEQEMSARKGDALYRIVMRNYGKPANPYSGINQMRNIMMSFNVMRSLGSMPVSAIPDLGQIITRLGIANIAGNLARLAAYPSGRKMAYEAARRLNLVTERVLASRMNQLTMTGDLAPGMGLAARFMHKQANYFITATGMNHWNQTLKEFALVSFSDEIMRTAIRLQTNPEALSTVKKAKFAAAGIDKGDWDYIYRMWDEHGEREGGLYIPMVDKWEDSSMKDSFLAVLNKEVNTAVVTPGAGDLPLWMREHVGAMIGQFKSFNFAATNKILVPGVQRMAMGDPNAIAGMVTQMMLGGAVYGLKMRLQDREPATDFPTIAREALDRSGYLAIFADINAITEKMSRGTLGIAGAYRLAGLENKDLSRYYTRPITGDIFGTSVGTFEDANKTIGALLSGEYSKGSLSSGRRMVPYQNLWYGRNGVNELQRWLEESMR